MTQIIKLYVDDIRIGIFYYPRKGMIKGIYSLTNKFNFTKNWNSYEEILDICI